MKGLLSVGVVGLVLGVLFFASRSWSEPQKPPAAPRTRIGLVNIGYVLKKYEKVDVYKKEMKEDFKQVQDSLDKGKEQNDELFRLFGDKDLPDAKRQEYAAQLEKLHKELEQQSEKWKDHVSKKTEEQAVSVYTDIRQAAERYAKAHDLEVVLHYIEAVNEADFLNGTNVMAKMQMRACMPIYMAPGIDISAEITADLNKRWAEGKKPAADKK